MEVEELESLLGPDASDVNFRRILEDARDEKGCAIFETFSSVVVNAPWWQNFSSSSTGRQWNDHCKHETVPGRQL